jgi:charged multivesicular body protein 5
MNRLFGSSKPVVKPTMDEAIQKTDARSETINQKIRGLDVQLAKLKEQMSKMKDGPAKNSVKQKALKILQQKKLYESQNDQLMKQSFTMTNVAMTTDNLKNTIVTVDAMKSAKKEMQKTFKKINIDKIEQVVVFKVGAR